MRSRLLSYGMLLLGLMISLLIACSNSDDCPTCPKKPPQAQEHLFYVTSGDGLVKIFSAEERAFIDSLVLTPNGVIEDVIGGNKMLAIWRSDGSRIFDLQTQKDIYTFPNACGIHVSPDGQYIALEYRWSDPYSTRLEIRRFDDLNLLFTDTFVIESKFSNDSRFITYLHNFQKPTPNNELVVYDIKNDSIVEQRRKYTPAEQIYMFFPTVMPSEKKVFFFGGTWATWKFIGVTDFGSDSVRILAYLGDYNAQLELSPDDQRLYYTTAPGWDDPPSMQVYALDAIDELPLAQISTSAFGHQPWEIAISPDGKFILTGSAFDQYDNKVGLIDAVKMTAVGAYDFGSSNGSPIYPSVVTAAKFRK